MLGGSALLTLALTQSANAAVGKLHLGNREIVDPARDSCYTAVPGASLPVVNNTNSPVAVFDQSACTGNVVGMVWPVSNGFFPKGWSVRVMQ